MRFLNRIVFINSANIAYADIGIAGNVHFIGTQGVGKSTILRAILFFYNADKLKLGIEKGKRSFDDYYLPHANSYIIYEVATETGDFCVLTYRSQGRAAFRFIDGAYNRDKFISQENKAMPWEQVRDMFTAVASYTRKIDRYEEYRDILYGNNRGLSPQFRKYALIESRQYQNLPRTIQNVFLNSKLEAEFIKQTIIMSLNEEDISIDLNQYALHLRSFDQQLSDIGKWSERNRSGEVVVRLLAGRIAELYSQIRFLEKEKQQLTRALQTKHLAVEEMRPVALRRLNAGNERLALARGKLEHADSKFQDKKDKINKEIIQLEFKLNEARKKSQAYEQMDIQGIIGRVALKASWESKKTALQAELGLLKSRYQEISTKYETLILQQKNQLNQFVNARNTEVNDLKGAFLVTKEGLTKQSETIIDGIEAENVQLIGHAEGLIDEKKERIHQLELKRSEAGSRRWFETEISAAEKIIAGSDKILSDIQAENLANLVRIESLQKHWDLDTARIQLDQENKQSGMSDQIAQAKKKIDQNRKIVLSSKNSLYEWLHENKPGWEETVGKVIDQKSVLFNSELSPRLVSSDSDLFFGIELNLDDLSSDVRSLEDYNEEIQKLLQKIGGYEMSLTALAEEQLRDAEKLRKKYQPQIKVLKEQLSVNEYNAEKAVQGRKSALLELDEWRLKAANKKQEMMEALKLETNSAREEKAAADEYLLQVHQKVRKQMQDKRKEKVHRIDQEETKLLTAIERIDAAIAEERARVERRLEEIQAQSKSDMEDEGADISRISAIEREFENIDKELHYIDNNRDRVVEYNKDKRDFFDQVDLFKTDKKLHETKLTIEQQRYEASKVKLQEAVEACARDISVQKEELRVIDDDLQAFNNFSQTDTYAKLIADDAGAAEKSVDERRLTVLIASVSATVHDSMNRMIELRTTTSRFLSHFSASNIFDFKVNLVDDEEFLRFAENLSEFLQLNKIEEYEKRTNEQFAHLVFQISKETTELVSKEGIISGVIRDINKDFEERNFAGVIKSIGLRLTASNNKIVSLLQEIRSFNNEYSTSLGSINLFSNNETIQNNKRAVSYLKTFADEITRSKQTEVNLSDTFELEFRIVENDNDSGWVEKLTNVGSEGTDVLVKAMINIMLLNVFKEGASRKFKDFRLHCMMDEIGKLHPNNVKGILKFANDRNIVLINSSPTSYNAVDYKHTYLLAKDSRNATTVKRLVTNNISHGIEQSLSR